MNLILSFTNQSADFTAGVELGRILARMESSLECVSNSGFPVRIENVAVLRNACKTYGYVPHFGAEYYGEWVEFFAIKSSSLNN